MLTVLAPPSHLVAFSAAPVLVLNCAYTHTKLLRKRWIQPATVSVPAPGAAEFPAWFVVVT